MSPSSGKRETSPSKFELIAELGRGGMATVYLARAKKRPEKLIVLKQLRADLAENPEFLAMFLEEARLAGRLSHPNIVETYEVGQDAGTYYIAMEYLDGLSLQTILTKFGWKGAFTFPMQVWVLVEALKALEHAYTTRDDDGNALKIVHRDVSPPNIIVTFDGQVKLVDFGIAKAANSHVETRTGLIKGKLTYMAPEQAQSGDVDNRTDIYSIGVMLWQSASGRRRWKGIDNTDVLRRLHAGDVSEAPGATANGLPSIVDDIVLKAIEPDPEKRHRSASSFRALLESLLREMHSEISSKDIAKFMMQEFGDVRDRASSVMRRRIDELDGVAKSEEKESVTAIRTGDEAAPAKKAKISERRVAAASRPISTRPAGEAPSRSAEERTSSVSTTAVSPTYGRSSRILVVGLVVAAALAVAAVVVEKRGHGVSLASDAPRATATPSATQAGPPPTIPTDAPAALPTALPASADTALAPSASAASIPSLVPTNRRRPRSHEAHPAPASTAQPAETGVAPAPTPVAVPTAVPVAAPTSNDSPSLDRKDPWSAKPPSSVDRTDPWGK